jgi:signal transduction histidine kinase
VLVLVVLAVTGAALVVTQRTVLTDSVDEVLQRRTSEVAALSDAGQLPDPIPGQGDEESFAEVIGVDGRVIARTTHSGPISAQAAAPPTDPVFAEIYSGDQHYRVLTELHSGVLVRAGTPLDDVDDSVLALVRGLGFSIPAATVLLALLVWMVLGRVLRPVESIRSQVAEISGGSLNRRVPVPGADDEIGRLARTMNEMLDRLERSSELQKRFVGDASHELRAPLARIRTEIDVGLAEGENLDAHAVLKSVSEDVDSLQQLVADLLALARSDGGAPLAHRVPVDLDDLVLREAERTRRRGVASIDLSAVSGAQVLGDPSQLSRVIRNLLDNAVAYGGGKIAVSLVEENGSAVLTVSDDGPGVSPEVQERMFERFTRADEARTPSAGGVGLGLSICRQIVEAHGGTISFDPSRPRGARIVARLPVTTADQS